MSSNWFDLFPLFQVTDRYNFILMPFAFPHCCSFCQSPHLIDSPQFHTIPPCLLNSLLAKALFSMWRTILHYPETDKQEIMWIQIISISVEGMRIVHIACLEMFIPLLSGTQCGQQSANQSNDMLSEYSILWCSAHSYSLLQKQNQLHSKLVLVFKLNLRFNFPDSSTHNTPAR